MTDWQPSKTPKIEYLVQGENNSDVFYTDFDTVNSLVHLGILTYVKQVRHLDGKTTLVYERAKDAPSTNCPGSGLYWTGMPHRTPVATCPFCWGHVKVTETGNLADHKNAGEV